MKKIIWLSIILLSVNMCFFPKKANVGNLNTSTGEYTEGTSSIYLAPIWAKSYDSHLITFVPSGAGVWDTTDFEGNVKAPELALGVWAIFFLIPSTLIFYFSIFFKKKRVESAD
jgi:hypothetical protein